MKLNNNISKELQEIAPMLAKLDKVNFYQVEDGYFERSRVSIIDAIGHPAVESEFVSSVLALNHKKEIYAAPAASYFESFSDAVITKVHAEDVEEELSYALPVLQHIEKKEPNQVPAAYFSTFPALITKLASNDAKAHHSPVDQWNDKWSILTEKVLGLIARPRYAFALASSIGMVICIAVAIHAQTSMSDDDKIFAQMQQIPDAELHHYISKHRDEFDERTILHNINGIDFSHYNDKIGGTDDEINEDNLD